MVSLAVKHVNTIIRYEGIQLFEGVDQIGTKYLCLAFDESGPGLITYLCVSISTERLASYRSGELSLRNVFKEPETGEWWLLLPQVMEANQWKLSRQKDIKEEWLPGDEK